MEESVKNKTRLAERPEAILPVCMIGVMIFDGPDMDDAPLPNALTSITYSRQGIEVGRDERRDRKKILDRLKSAITALEKAR
jgi:hypothetical protein